MTLVHTNGLARNPMTDFNTPKCPKYPDCPRNTLKSGRNRLRINSPLRLIHLNEFPQTDNQRSEANPIHPRASSTPGTQTGYTFAPFTSNSATPFQMETEPMTSMPEPTLRTTADIITDIETVCQEPGYLLAYAAMVCENLFIPQHMIATVNWHDRLNENELSWILGVMMRNEWNLDVSPSEHSIKTHIATTWELMQELHSSLLPTVNPHPDSENDTIDPQSPNLQALQDWLDSGVRFTEAIFYTELGAYDFQYLDFAKRRYVLDSEWIEAHLGTSIETLTEIAQRVTNLLSMRANQRESKSSFVEYCHHCVSILSFSKEDIFGDAQDIADCVLKMFSCTPGDVNQNFGTIGTYNAVHSHPLIHLDHNRYFLPLTYNFARAIYESPIYWMRNDANYYETAMSNRGSTTEGIAYDQLAKLCGPHNTFRNVKVQKGKTNLSEIDVLAICGNKAVIIQAKSKSLTELSRQGNSGSLKKDFEAAIQTAYVQGIVCRNALLSKNIRLKDENDQVFQLPIDIDDAYIICLTGDHYPAVLAQCSVYLQKQPSDPFPIALSLFDLDMLIFYLNDPFEFAYYLRQRSLFAEHFLADSELSLLGYHLCNKLSATEGFDISWVPNSYGQRIDAHFPFAAGHRVGHGAVGKLIFHWRSDAFNFLISQLKLTQEALVTDALFFLFDLDSEVSNKIVDKFEKLKENTRNASKRHSVSGQLVSNKSGFTLMVYPKTMINVDEFLFIAMRRKYISRSDEWFALLGTEDRSPLFHAFFYDKNPWHKDVKWETLGTEA